MTRLKKLPGGINKGLQRLVEKVRINKGNEQLRFLIKLEKVVEGYKESGFNVKKYEKFYREAEKYLEQNYKNRRMLKDFGLIGR